MGSEMCIRDSETLETVNMNVENLDVYFGGGYLMHNVHGKS